MIAFIDDHRGEYGVEPICRVLKIAPSTFHAHAARRRRPETAPPRVQRDEALKPHILRVFSENFEVYGVRKVWRQLLREGFEIARCTVSRLMKALGLKGVIRGKPHRTTFSDKSAPCPLDRVNRQFHASRPNVLWVSDFTYVATWSGFVYVAFVIDVYARRIVGCALHDRDVRSTHHVRTHADSEAAFAITQDCRSREGTFKPKSHLTCQHLPDDDLAKLVQHRLSLPGDR